MLDVFVFAHDAALTSRVFCILDDANFFLCVCIYKWMQFIYKYIENY